MIESPQRPTVDAGDVQGLAFVDADLGGADDAGAFPLRVALVGSPVLDPADVNEADSSSLFVVDVLFDGLTAVDPATGQIVPALAENWILSTDKREYTFVLRRGLTFSDGTVIDSSAVKSSIERVAARGDDGLTSAALEVIEAIEVVDERTMAIRVHEPFSALPELLANPTLGIVAPAGPYGAWSGAYRVTGEDGTALRFAHAGAEPAAPPRFEALIYANVAEAAEAFLRGDVDIATIPRSFDRAVEETGASVHTIDLGSSAFFGMNIEHPSLSNPLLRAALVHGVDRTKLATLWLGNNVVAASDVAGVPCGDECRFDPEYARELLAVAYPDGSYPIVPINYFDDESGDERRLVEAIAGQLAAIGLRTELRASDFDVYSALIAGQEPGLFRFGAVRSYMSPLAELVEFESTSPLNVTGYSDEAFDMAVDAALGGNRASQQTAGTLLANAFVIIPAIRYQAVVASSARVSGLELSPYGTYAVSNLILID